MDDKGTSISKQLEDDEGGSSDVVDSEISDGSNDDDYAIGEEADADYYGCEGYWSWS